MGTELRNYSADNIALFQTLKWTDLVSDPHEPETYLLDPLTGHRWHRITKRQESIANELVAGANYREACRAAGIKTNPESMSAYVCKLLATSAPFVNYLLIQLNELRQSQSVTKESHLQRLDHLGRRAEKEGKYSAAIAAEVARGRVEGLYANDAPPPDKRVYDTMKEIDERITELLANQKREKAVEGKVVSDQGPSRLERN